MDEKRKRFWLFVCPDYYPMGGLSDIVDTFDTVDEAMEHINKNASLAKGIDVYLYDRDTDKQFDCDWVSRKYWEGVKEFFS